MPPNVAPSNHQPQSNGQPAPDYSFLGEKPKRAIQLPTLKSKSFTARLAYVVGAFILLVILIIILKNLLVTPPFSNADYLVVAERQQEMQHILTSDITSSNVTELSTSNQDFVATASLTLQSSESQTLTLLAEDGDKVDSAALSRTFSSSVDTQVTGALAANNLSSVFQTVMSTQLGYYVSELSVAYNSTNSSSAKPTLRNEYRQAKLLEAALTSTNS
jgi:flagellar basal body-associated protein FliL